MSMVQQTAPKKPASNGMHRMTVRIALASGATIATLVGAQTFAILDRSVNQKDNSSLAPDQTRQPTASGAQSSAAALPASNNQVVTVALKPAPPHLVAFRDGGSAPVNNASAAAQSPTNSPNTQPSNIAPPAPVVVKPPPAQVPAAPAAQQGAASAAQQNAAPAAVQPAASQPQPVTKSSHP